MNEIAAISIESASDANGLPGSVGEFLLDGVYCAGERYFDALFGSADAARAALTAALGRKSSEMFASRALIMRVGAEPAGAFIALAGEQVVKSRKNDAIAFFAKLKPEEREAFQVRMQNLENVFAPPQPEDYYLSKFWIAPTFRSRKLSPVLLNAYCEAGRAMGFNRFRLDVDAENTPARRLYASAGFLELGQGTSIDRRITYVSMLKS